jgi:putative hydrolase of the HAD superfamily
MRGEALDNDQQLKTENTESISMIYLDMGHVITRAPSRENWKALLEMIGLPEAEFLSRYRDHRDAYDKGTMDTEIFWSRVIGGRENTPLESGRMERLLQADTTCWADYDPRMINWSDTLRNSGYTTGILSNMPLYYAGFARGLEWFNRFSYHILSAEIKQLKPEPEIYESAIAACGFPADEILFIDDLPANVAAAADAGLHAVQFTGVEALNSVVAEKYGLPPVV